MSGMPLWRPTPQQIARTNLADFMVRASAVSGLRIADYSELHRWSIEERADFWSLVWDYCGIVGERGADATEGELGLLMAGVEHQEAAE